MIDCDVADELLKLSFKPTAASQIRQFVIGNKDKVVSFKLEGEATLAIPEKEKILLVVNKSSITLSYPKSQRSINQNATLRGIERFIGYAMFGVEPLVEDLENIHEAIIEAVMPDIDNTITGTKYKMRTSDPRCDTKLMAKCIQHSLMWLAGCDIPEEVMQSIGHEMKSLWKSWYDYRYKREDPLFEFEQQMTWEKYREYMGACELCGVGDTEGNPLDRMHIVAVGADVSIREKPWNWLLAHRSHHALQHGEGWDEIINEFPHIEGKIERARKRAGKKCRQNGSE